jgi:hypothetical protein
MHVALVSDHKGLYPAFTHSCGVPCLHILEAAAYIVLPKLRERKHFAFRVALIPSP